MKHEYLPEGWRWVRFDEIAFNIVERNGNNPNRTVMAVTKYDGLVPSLEYFDRQVYSEDISKYKVVRKNQFAYAVIHLDEGSIGMNTSDEPVLVSPVYVVFGLDEQVASPQYFQHLLKSDFMMMLYQTIGEGTVERRKAITFETLSSGQIPLPPLDEQCRIAEVLRATDENSIDIETEIVSVQELKNGAIQSFFTGFSTEIASMRLNRLLHRVRREVDVKPDNLYKEIGIRSHGKGIFHKKPVYGKELNTKSVYWVEPGDFILNIVFAWEGAVALVSETERGMCGSHRFPTYEINRELVRPDYLLWYFKSPLGLEQLQSVSPGGAGRNKTLNQSGFMKLRIPTPSIEEQNEIATILNGYNTAIEDLQVELDSVREIKRGLMQKLLTGEIRV